jgi:hypothetical protein
MVHVTDTADRARTRKNGEKYTEAYVVRMQRAAYRGREALSLALERRGEQVRKRALLYASEEPPKCQESQPGPMSHTVPALLAIAGEFIDRTGTVA